jgi:lysophospholipase L1-like esterase
MRKFISVTMAHRRWRIFTPLLCCLLIGFIFTPIVAASAHRAHIIVGPKQYYLALGDSLAYGFQPDLNFADGYASDFYSNLKTHGVTARANLGCPDETSATFIHGGCPFALMHKYFYRGAQLNVALSYLAAHQGQVSPVTLDIGANDVLPDLNAKTCAPDVNKFAADLATLDANLQQVILPRLHSALMINGIPSGDLVVMNYYDPYQNLCPNTLPYLEELNQHLAADVAGYGSVVDVFSAFGGTAIPNPNTCSYTWICSIFKDVHARSSGYSVIAHAFEAEVGY